MASASIESSTSERLESRIARATRGRTRALVRTTIPVSAWDPWRYLERARERPGPWFAWSSRDGNQTFIAMGAVAHHAATSADGWKLSDSFCSDMSKQAVSLGFEGHEPVSEALPLIVGGLRFSSQESSTVRTPWAGWSSGALWVPELVLMERDGQGVACLTQPWTQGQDTRALANYARKRARELERHVSGRGLRLRQQRGFGFGPGDGDVRASVQRGGMLRRARAGADRPVRQRGSGARTARTGQRRDRSNPGVRNV